MLCNRNVCDSERGLSERGVLAAAHDTDNLEPWPFRPAETDSLADRALAAKMHFYGRLVHDHDGWPSFDVRVAEIPAGEKRNTDCAEESRTDDVRVDPRGAVAYDPGTRAKHEFVRVSLAPFDHEAGNAACPAQHRDARDASRFDARQTFYPLHDLPVKLSTGGSGIAEDVDVERRGDEFFNINTRMD